MLVLSNFRFQVHIMLRSRKWSICKIKVKSIFLTCWVTQVYYKRTSKWKVIIFILPSTIIHDTCGLCEYNIYMTNLLFQTTKCITNVCSHILRSKHKKGYKNVQLNIKMLWYVCVGSLGISISIIFSLFLLVLGRNLCFYFIVKKVFELNCLVFLRNNQD